ncbi:MAG: filamentous hemagglutinin N-terminal domain-containing protein [Candidatus Parabeggiatoa sp.]|nr:filamentous hemagglutinin N-terminal domain-containing protein [Candidatus Parabeggiatoa sp.]
MKPQSLLTILFLIISLPIRAQITTDGTLGQKLNLPGPDYQIGADLGQQHGNNLFHSFQDFNLQSHESATFTGQNPVQNVISRVTGGNPSNIDGLIRSTLPNADLYFINPFGILFGPHAKLDVQGSFHASTADYLRLEDGGSFHARQPNESLLTVAPVEAFGFLTDTPAPMTLQDSQLFVPFSKTLSLVGGDLLMQGQLPSNDESDIFHPNYPLKLFAEFGRINLISLASQGEVIPIQSDIILNAKQTGKIIANNTWIGVSGDGAGDLFIRGGRFELNNSELESDSGDKDSGIIDIQVEHLNLNGSEIATDTHGRGQGGKIILKIAETLNLSGTSEKGAPTFIFSGTEGLFDNAGDAGKIEIEARKIVITEGARISSFTQGPGKGGAIVIKASERLIISGLPEAYFRNDPFANINNIETHLGKTGVSALLSNSKSLEVNAGHAGMISIQAPTINLTDHSLIAASAKNAGGGDITITTPNFLSLQNSRITTSVKSGTGNGGDITIEQPVFVVLNNSKIAAQADKGRGGNIGIRSEQFIASSDSLVSASSKLGLDGEVNIDAPDMNLDEFLVVLPGGFVEASLKECDIQDIENPSTFKIHSRQRPVPFIKE